MVSCSYLKMKKIMYIISNLGRNILIKYSHYCSFGKNNSVSCLLLNVISYLYYPISPWKHKFYWDTECCTEKKMYVFVLEWRVRLGRCILHTGLQNTRAGICESLQLPQLRCCAVWGNKVWFFPTKTLCTREMLQSRACCR